MIGALAPGARIHLLGICGTAMASLAGLFAEKGFRVTGSDANVYPPMSELLARLGLEVRSPYRSENVPEGVDLVVVGNALSRGNPELEAVLERRIPYVSMPEVLKDVFLRERLPVVVAGTHGKTSTASLTAWLLESGGRSPGFLVGGIPLNFKTSFRAGTGENFVVEGDEYDTAFFDKGPKFLHYLPRVAVLANVEFDHADIYENLGQVVKAFRLFVNLVPRNGLLVAGTESAVVRDLVAGAPSPVETFAASPGAEADWTGEILDEGPDGSRFRLRHRGASYLEARGAVWGRAGLENLLAAVAVAHHVGLGPDEISRALPAFRGVRRRLEVRGEASGVTVVDDFAHHPTAIGATLAMARRRWSGRKLWALFEPRSFTARSSVFQTEMAEALAGADEVVIAPVFSSHRLAEKDELSEERLVEDLRQRGTEATFIGAVDEIVTHVAGRARREDVVLAMSNGSFGGVHEKLLAALGGQS